MGSPVVVTRLYPDLSAVSVSGPPEGFTGQKVTANGAIPASLAAGTYYLGEVADALSMIPESNESNNALAGGALVVSAP